MTTHRLYIDPDRIEGELVTLSPQQAHQVTRVLRLRTNDEVIVFDGTGVEYRATVNPTSANGQTVHIVGRCWPRREPTLRLHVGLALVRNDRFELAVQKLTELGVASITPVAANRSVISYSEASRWTKRHDRLRRISIEAAEQSERTTLLEILTPKSVDDILETHAHMPIIALVERGGGRDPIRLNDGVGDTLLLVGPEGGWSPRELCAISTQATRASLGGLILRSETAAIVGAAILLHQANEGHGQ